jgi:hypothetical protein
MRPLLMVGGCRTARCCWRRLCAVDVELQLLRLELVRACGFDLETSLIPYEADSGHDARLEKTLGRSPQDRLQAMLKARAR